jgi:hypothetical protein
MNPDMIYEKIGIAIAVIALLFFAGYHVGGLAAHNQLETVQAKQLSAVTTVLEQQRDQALAESKARQGIIDAYETTKDVLDPINVGVGHRMYVYASGTGCSSVSGTATMAGGTPAPAAKPASNQSVDRLSELSQSIIDACTADAHQMNAMIDFAKIK